MMREYVSNIEEVK